MKKLKNLVKIAPNTSQKYNLVSIQLILVSIKALDTNTEQKIIDKLAQFPELKLLYVNIFFNQQKKIKKQNLESNLKKLLLILKTSCSNDYIKNQLQIYKKIINSNKVLKIPKTTYQNYFGLLQYLKKFIYYYKLINSNVSENESKITALQSLLLLESFIE